MKKKSIILIAASGLVASALSSCVYPYDSHGGATVITSSYHQPGYRINSLPVGYRSEVISGRNYYYHNGAYFRRDSQGYVVVEAPRSSRYYNEYNRHRGSGNYHTSGNSYGQQRESLRTIRRLPSGYRTLNHGDARYYTVGDTYYQRQGSGYTVVNRPSVSRLPSGYRTLNHGGAQYYSAGDTYYQRQGSTYIVVSRPY